MKRMNIIQAFLVFSASLVNIQSLFRYYSMVIVEICIALVCTAWVLRYHYRNPAMGKIPRWIRVSKYMLVNTIVNTDTKPASPYVYLSLVILGVHFWLHLKAGSNQSA